MSGDGFGSSGSSSSSGTGSGSSEDVSGGLGGDALEKVRTDEKARGMLKVLEESESGRVGTSELRERTGMGKEIHYRYEKLEDAGLIEVEYDSGATPEGVSPMKVAVLTERGERAVAEGLSGDAADVTEDTVEDRLSELEAQLGENREALEDVYEWMRKVNERLDRLEERVDLLAGEDVSDLQGDEGGSENGEEDGFDWDDS